MITSGAAAPLQPQQLWAAWNPDPWILGLAAVGAAIYAGGILRLPRFSRRGRAVANWRVACFAAGWTFLLLGLLSPIAALGSALFTAHMVQHTILMQLAAPLLVAGLPLISFLWILPRRWRGPVARLRTAPLLGPLVRIGGHPFMGWMLYAVALWAWHMPALYEAALRHHAVHHAQHLTFFVAALLFWWPLIRSGRPTRAQLGIGVVYVFTTALHMGALGALLTFASRPWYAAYQHTTVPWGITPLEDQQLGGLIMWVPGGLLYTAAMLLLVGSLLRSSGPDTASDPAALPRLGPAHPPVHPAG